MTKLLTLLVAGAVAAFSTLGCEMPDSETRARQALEKIRASMPNVEARALEQKAEPAAIKTAQEHLTRVNEYQGEINGVLDLVTVNAIEAFQNRHGLEADGLLTDDTMRSLREAAAQKQS